MADFVGANDPSFASIYAAASQPGAGTPGSPNAGAPGTIGAAIPSGLVTPNGSGPGVDPQGPGGSFAAGSVQGQALANPNQPYIGTAESGGIAYTPAQARAWWNQWFQNPVNLLTVDPTMLPGSLVLTPDEIARARALQADGTLPPAPADYNPLGLQVNAGSNGLSSFGGYGSAAEALQHSSMLNASSNGDPGQQAYLNTLKSLGIENPVYKGAGVGYNQLDAYNQAMANNTDGAVPQYVNGRLVYTRPNGQPIEDQAYAAQLAAGIGVGADAVAQQGGQVPQTTPLSPTDARIAKLEAAIQSQQQAIARLTAVQNPNAKQQAALRTDQGSLAAQQAELAQLRGQPAPATVQPAGPSNASASVPAVPQSVSNPAPSQPSGNVQATGSMPTAPAASGGGATSSGTKPVEDIGKLQAAVAQDQKYISNLSAVKNPTQKQKDELAMYQQRVGDYNTRIQAAGG